MNVLIVEDESIVAMEIKSYLQNLDYFVVDICSNATDAFNIVSESKVNIVLMDICIKGELDGVEVAEKIKNKYPNIEIIFLTAHLDDYNVDRAIEVDPVAYLSKPFNREELRIFLKIATQKINKNTKKINKNKNHIILDHEFCYDMSHNNLYCCDEPIHLTKKENDLLHILIKYKNSIVNFNTIENVVWPDKITNTNTIRTLVKRVRQKLKYKFIETVSSQGYKLHVDFTSNNTVSNPRK